MKWLLVIFWLKYFNSLMIFFSLLVLMSCGILNNGQDETVIEGSITASKFMIPILCKLSFYSENKFVEETTTDVKGQYSLEIQRKYQHKKCFLIVEPLQESNFKDTSRIGSRLIRVKALGLEVDTFFYDSFELISDIELKKYQLMEIEVHKDN